MSRADRQSRRLAVPSLLAGLMLAGGGCASTVGQVDLYKGPPVQVSLRYDVEGGRPVPKGYSHPASLTASEVEKVLGAVGFEKLSVLTWSDKGPLFSAGEIAQLAPKLAEGLRKATADQWVYFSVTGERGSTSSATPRFTDGICFVENGRLNLVLGNIFFDTAEKYVTSSEPSTIDPRDLRAFEDVRLTAKGLGPAVAPPPLVPGDRWLGRARSNWLVYDLAAFLAPAPEAPRAVAAPTPPPAAAAPAAAASPAPMAAPAPPAPPAPPAALDPAERLQRLKDLLDRGLITPEEYQAKRQEILKSL